MIDRTATIVGALWVVTALGLPGLAATAEKGAADPLERVRALEGEWVAAEDGEMAKRGDLVSRYEITAAGSAVVETVFPGSPYEMVTVYHAEGADLVLTHYCMRGNQPRMRARDTAADRIRFEFESGGNIADPGRDRHMHSAWLEIVDSSELRTEWTEIEGGEPVLAVPMRLVRKGS